MAYALLKFFFNHFNVINITIVQAYAPKTDYDEEEIEDIYKQLQEVLDQVPKKDTWAASKI